MPAVELVSGNTLTMLTMSFVVSGYQLDRTRCTASHGKLTLTPHGLPQTMTLDRDARAVFHDRCVAPRMLVRIRLTTDAAGIPLRAKLFVARPAGSKPLVYVDWSRTKVTAYASGDCVAME